MGIWNKLQGSGKDQSQYILCVIKRNKCTCLAVYAFFVAHERICILCYSLNGKKRGNGRFI